ncbi:AAA family ATPase [Shewanella sp. SM72]|jgi:energy-coupling factor transporter ATP-binding protein EcfA2|uniref:AAA family ATPase n=1 Tax=Shewanella sp. SM72 TaxID=2912805 RepID=UPI0021DB7CC3|nr:ATP-binding protein [Shewanella sp. SM72]MCU8019894.1 AAA family ATPase [Shewanella sp. SM72]
MIKTISVTGFKSLMSEQPIELGQVNCFIGANGVGKSNILEALGVIGAAANGVVDDESLLRRGVRAGVPKLYKSSFASERTPAHIGISVTSSLAAEYRVSLLNPLESPDPAWSFKTEYLFDGCEEIITDGIRAKKNLNPTAGLAALKQVELNTGNYAYELMQSLRDYAIYCPNTPTLRGITQDIQSRSPVGLSGGLLAEAFETLRKHLTQLEDTGEEVLDEIYSLIDWVADINITSQAGSLLSAKVPRAKHLIKFTDRYMKSSRNELTAYDASEGALYVLFAAVLCLLPQSPKVFAIDNLDQALNPRLLASLTRKLSKWLKLGGNEKQLLFTAHNPAVLDGLDLTNDEVRLFAVERNSNGLTQIRRVTLTPELKSLNKDYPLSRLWLMGHLGAVPNV